MLTVEPVHRSLERRQLGQRRTRINSNRHIGVLRRQALKTGLDRLNPGSRSRGVHVDADPHIPQIGQLRPQARHLDLQPASCRHQC